jgi:hypothetical protein
MLRHALKHIDRWAVQSESWLDARWLFGWRRSVWFAVLLYALILLGAILLNL